MFRNDANARSEYRLLFVRHSSNSHLSRSRNPHICVVPSECYKHGGTMTIQESEYWGNPVPQREVGMEGSHKQTRTSFSTNVKYS